MSTVIEDFSVYRTAKHLIDQLGEKARAHVAEQALDRLNAGKIKSMRRCQRILFAVEKLNKNKLNS